MICFFCGNTINENVCPFCNREQPVLSGGDGYFNIVKEMNSISSSQPQATAAQEVARAPYNELAGSATASAATEKLVAQLNNDIAKQKTIIDEQNKSIHSLVRKSAAVSKTISALFITLIVVALLSIGSLIWIGISTSNLREEINSLRNIATTEIAAPDHSAPQKGNGSGSEDPLDVDINNDDLPNNITETPAVPTNGGEEATPTPTPEPTDLPDKDPENSEDGMTEVEATLSPTAEVTSSPEADVSTTSKEKASPTVAAKHETES